MKEQAKMFVGFAIGFLVAFVMLTQGYQYYRHGRDGGAATVGRGGDTQGSAPARLLATDSSQVTQLQDAIEGAASSAEQSVVTINTKSFREIQDWFFNIRKVPQEGLGSGVIFDKNGYVLTNNHVVAGAQEILVSLLDGRNLPGKVVGRDPDTDIAVVQITADKLPVIAIGDSKLLKKAQLVLAIGNPFGLESTVTFGVISALGRSIKPSQNVEIENLIQIDAAINRGNSGGALVDLSGRLVGINTAIIPPNEGHGIGFAIPINQAIDTAYALVAHGKITRPWLGLIPRNVPLEDEQAKAYDLPGRIVLVDDVYRDGPADVAGVLPNDVILEAGGKQIYNSDDLKKVVRSMKIGDRLSLKVLRVYSRRRGSERLTLEAKLSDKPLDAPGV
ncbi:MAG: S1C family serine protease [bacterium]